MEILVRWFNSDNFILKLLNFFIFLQNKVTNFISFLF
jgi:hypothetical protein